MTVYLVGAGPGDPGLLTVRGASLLARADVVIHDRLASPSLLAQAPPGALLIDVGKRPGGPIRQDEINALLVEHGRRPGSCVVRLKGGDPFVFGRGGEEAQALIEAGVGFEVVPGVTSAVAVPAYAGIPVTHRGLSTSFTVVTGHSRHAADEPIDWEAVGHQRGTIVVLMGVAHRTEMSSQLIAAGRAPDTPVAAIRWGTRPDQRTVRTTLAALPLLELEPPVTLVVGPVAALDLPWFERRPLFGSRVLVTRSRDQASSLVSRLSDLGADVTELPLIEIADPADGGTALRQAAVEVARYRWVVFASANAVRRFCALLRDGRAFGTASVAAVGPGTAEALRDFGVVADVVPTDAVAESLVSAIGAAPPGPSGPSGWAGRRVLVPRAAGGRDALVDGLGALGWEVDAVEAYRTVPAAVGADDLAAAASADAVAFASSSTVTSYLAALAACGLGPPAPVAVPPLVVCIGPVTARTAQEAGLHVDAVADPHSIEGLVDALVGLLARRP